jgi:hypothetical protein
MSHWFDDLAIDLARSSTVPRRTLLRLAAITAAASALTRFPFSRQASAQASACPRRRVGNAVVNDVTLSKNRVTLRRQLTHDTAKQTSTLSETVTRQNALVAKIDFVTTGTNSAAGTIVYGPEVRGPKRVALKTTDGGKTVEGNVDGRAFIEREGRRTFADGQPEPKVELDASIEPAVLELHRQTRDLSAHCQSAWENDPHNPRGPKFKRSAHGTLVAPGPGAYPPLGADNPGCVACQNQCDKDWGAESGTAWCVLTLGGCYVKALIDFDICRHNCASDGPGGCFPVPCGSTTTTCNSGDQCFSVQGAGMCCDAGAPLCQGVCCGRLITACGPDGSCGCRTDETLCGDSCCDNAKEICSNGICCPKGQANHEGTCCAQKNLCGKVCCDELASCADPKTGLCCPLTAPVCGGKCCKPGNAEVCINGTCCPSERACGGKCCPAGQTCADPKKGVCTACHPGLVPCLPDKGPSICCPPNVACCPGGACCKPGESCNYIGNNAYACGPPQTIK